MPRLVSHLDHWARKGRPIQQEQNLGFKVKAERERRPRRLEGESGFGDGYHVGASFLHGDADYPVPDTEPTYQLSPIIYHPKTFHRQIGLRISLLCNRTIHQHYDSAHGFCCLKRPLTVLSANLPPLVRLSFPTTQVISYLSETTPQAPFKYSSFLSLPLLSSSVIHIFYSSLTALLMYLF